MKRQMLMVDLSSNNPPPNLKQLWKDGQRVIGLKGTEGNTYRWSQAEKYAKEWHRMGGICVYYAFAHPGGAVVQAAYFWGFVRKFYQHGDWLACDAEIQGLTASEVKLFHHTLREHTAHLRRSAQRLTYGSPSFLSSNKITKYYGERLWLAEYGPKADIPRGWKTWTLWQITNEAHINGVHGNVDLSKVSNRVFEPTLIRGDSSICVMHLKHMLREHGYRGMVSNMKFGIGCQRAVKKFKKDHHLHVDGSVTRAVWDRLHGKVHH